MKPYIEFIGTLQKMVDFGSVKGSGEDSASGKLLQEALSEELNRFTDAPGPRFKLWYLRFRVLVIGL